MKNLNVGDKVREKLTGFEGEIEQVVWDAYGDVIEVIVTWSDPIHFATGKFVMHPDEIELIHP
jgi:hypothetical protein